MYYTNFQKIHYSFEIPMIYLIYMYYMKPTCGNNFFRKLCRILCNSLDLSVIDDKHRNVL